jgi:hypothetical protein
MMLFAKAFCIGFATTLGVEIALGFCFAIASALKGASRK